MHCLYYHNGLNIMNNLQTLAPLNAVICNEAEFTSRYNNSLTSSSLLSSTITINTLKDLIGNKHTFDSITLVNEASQHENELRLATKDQHTAILKCSLEPHKNSIESVHQLIKKATMLGMG